MFNIFNLKIINNKVLYLLLFAAVFSYFLWLNASPNFSDPDAFYHAKMAELIKEQGIVKNFSWLPFTTLDQSYVDHQLLYHILLVPFIIFFNPLLGLKIATVFFAALLIIIWQTILDKWKIKFSFIYTLLLLLSNHFIFRINLAKTSSLSIIFILIFIYFLFRDKNKSSWPLIIIGFLYVWLYAGWPIMLGMAFIYFFVNLFFKKFKINTYRLQATSYQLQKVLSVIAGIIFGLVINPYFPTNLKFYWQQTVKIGLVNYKNIIDVGAEWYSDSLVNIIAYNAPLFILLVIALVIMIGRIKKQDKKTWTLFFTTFIFFILTVKSKRNIEYLVPTGTLFIAFVFNQAWAEKEKYKEWLKKFNQTYLPVSLLLLSLTVILVPIILLTNLFSIKNALAENYEFNKFKGISNWLKTNTEPGEIIFHDRWDDWPVLFYYNDYNRYIIGLDPSFLYFQDKNKYFLWRTMVNGEKNSNLCLAINSTFKTKYVLVNRENNKFNLNVKKDKKCEMVYSDKDGYIYHIN